MNPQANKVSTRYIVLGTKPWNRTSFDRHICNLPGDWLFLSSKEELDLHALTSWTPRYLFFLHWSWIVPQTIVDQYECVCFHMTDVPYGRGGTPLQNLISRGHAETKLTALRMTQELDAGPVYGKRNLRLDGTAEQIYIAASDMAASMIAEIVRDEPTPIAQTGVAQPFARRKPEQSALPQEGGLDALYDHIRMLDASGYPKAFIRHGDFILEFSRAAVYNGKLKCDVEIKIVDKETRK